MKSARAALSRLTFAVLLLSLVACRAAPSVTTTPADTRPVTIKILSTTDVHGWINPNVVKKANRTEGGLAEIAAAWRSVEGVDPSLPRASRRGVLLLDSGDMWTGPPESTLAKGAPLVEAFNALGYDAAALGNHEFDFGLETLRQHARTLRFPLLCANVGAEPGGPAVDFCRKSTLLEVNGIQVGVIGLATTSTPRTTFPTHVTGLTFGDLTRAVQAEGATLVGQGATVLIVIAHEDLELLEDVANATQDLPIRLFLGGHSHRREVRVLERDPATRADDVVLLHAGPFARSYGRVELSFQNGALVAHSEAVVPIDAPLDAPRRYDPEPVTARIAEQARAATEAKMAEVVGHARSAMEVGTVDSSPLGFLVLDAWLEQYPRIKMAIGNLGGIRQPLQPGPITLGDVFGVLPFTNDLVEVDLSPAEMRELLSVGTRPIVAGMRYHYRMEGERRVVTRIDGPDGKPLEEGRRYPLLTTDFLYLGGDGMPFSRMDPDPTFYAVSWRDPFIALFRRHGAAGVEPPRDVRAVRD